MTWLRVTLSTSPASFRPGEVLTGEAAWKLEEPLEGLDLKLCWTTDGHTGGGGPPVVVLQERIPVEAPEGRRDFRFELPAGPWSFQGKLFSVEWYVELAKDEYTYSRGDFVLGPEAEPIVAKPPEQPPPAGVGESERIS